MYRSKEFSYYLVLLLLPDDGEVAQQRNEMQWVAKLNQALADDRCLYYQPGSFIKNIVNDPIAASMVEAINSIGHVMGIKTIAEFVADKNILDKVKAIGVDYAQGYAIAPPQPLLQVSQPIFT